MSTPVIGIDLGTTNSVVSYTDGAGVTHVVADENGDRIVPSVVQFGSDGSVVVGKNAKAYAKVEPDRVASVFKRGMGDSTFLPDGSDFVVDGVTHTPEQLSALVLKKLADVASRELGAPATRAVITVPHYFGEPERAATRSAGEIAGLEVVQIINEPTAAAIARGADGEGDASGRLLVFDLGGGTFDVTVMEYGAGREMTVIASRRRPRARRRRLRPQDRRADDRGRARRARDRARGRSVAAGRCVRPGRGAQEGALDGRQARDGRCRWAGGRSCSS